MSEAEPAPDIKPSAPAAGPQQVSEAEPTASQQQSPLDAATLSGPTEVKLESINAPAPEVKTPQAPVPEPTAPTTTTIKEEPPAAERASADISGGNPSAPQLTPPNTNHTYAPPQPNRQSNGSIQNASSGLAPPLTTNTANPTSMQSMVNQTQPIYAPPQTTQAPIGSPLPSGMPPMGAYMHPYPGMQMGSPQMRYQLPGDHSKMLSGSRHKKEVKRRTKTGCLTCRKRRIKVSLQSFFFFFFCSCSLLREGEGAGAGTDAKVSLKVDCRVEQRRREYIPPKKVPASFPFNVTLKALFSDTDTNLREYFEISFQWTKSNSYPLVR